MPRFIHAATFSVVAILAACLFGLVAASSVLADPGPASIAKPSALTPPAADAPQLEHAEYWRARAAAEWAKVEDARARLDRANGAVNRMRRRNHPRGDARAALQQEQRDAQADWEAAVEAAEVDLAAEAAAAGADPRWIRKPS